LKIFFVSEACFIKSVSNIQKDESEGKNGSVEDLVKEIYSFYIDDHCPAIHNTLF